MTYKNKKTGSVVQTTGRVSGGEWEELAEHPARNNEDGDKEIHPENPLKKPPVKRKKDEK